MSDKKTLILIDGHALAFRQFFALERTGMKNSENQPTWNVSVSGENAVFFLSPCSQNKPWDHAGGYAGIFHPVGTEEISLQ